MIRGFGRFLRRNTIAMLALFIALSGTTFAASMALPANSVGTKQLKKNAVTSVKIKNNQVTGADVNESSLGKVPSAANADHATAADNATNATNASVAASASNAAALNGEGPSVYLDRGAQGTNQGAVTVASLTATETVAPISITVPSGVNFVQVDAQTTLAGAAAASNWIIWFQEDSLCTDFSGPGIDNRPYGRLEATNDQGTLYQHLIVGVSPGVHTFRLCVLSDAAAGAYDNVLIVHTIPRGSTGGATLGPRGMSHASSHRLGHLTTP
jgi:hypothetical protein